jgi:2-methylcitrate dehydratase PrpD
MANVTRSLAEFLATATVLPEDVIEPARRAVLDWLGSVLAGSIEPPARMAQRIAAGFGESDQSTVFSSGRASAAAAAFSNGVASHILEFDDVHKGSTLHAGAPVIPAALAVAEREHSTGREFLLAVAVGYETALRVGEAVNPSHYYYWHPTGTAATFGAAAAAGSLLHLDTGQMQNALGTAGTQAAGLWEFNADGAMSKHLHPGKAAMNGIMAADLAREGFTGASRILEGERGFFRAMSQSHDAARITEHLGQRWKIAENCYKLHSCCGHTHTAIDVALDLISNSQLRPNAEIAAIEIETYAPGFEIVKEMNPRTPYQAKFSLAYCVAAALSEGRVGLEQFPPKRFDPEGVLDPKIAALLKRTGITVALDLTAKYPAAWPTRVTIKMADGSTLHGHADYPRGNPENPVSTEVLENKLIALLTPRFGTQTVNRALDAWRSVERCADMARAFSAILTPP